MLDLTWERSAPIIDVGVEKIASVFAAYNRDLTVISFNPIQLGCRNSNFVVLTNRGKYLFRMAPVYEINNEIFVFELVKDKVNVPNLLFHARENGMNIFIYQYINGLSLQKRIIESGYCEPVLLEQAAKFSALIHSIPKEKAIGFEEYDIPPFETWYQHFLDETSVKVRLGDNLLERARKLVLDKQNFMPEIAGRYSLIHNDFRPANMLADANGQLFIVDWECAGMGHSLADIGQFFRYRSFFNTSDIERFEQIYNEYAIRKLPYNWADLSLFRDLVNPLQMLSTNQEMAAKTADLLKVIEEILVHFGY